MGDENKVEETAAPNASMFIGGEIHIVADGKTGAIRVNAPQNRIVAYGLLDMAKEILADEARRAHAVVEKAMNERKTIIPASEADMKTLGRA